jgi:hypothetical protein
LDFGLLFSDGKTKLEENLKASVCLRSANRKSQQVGQGVPLAAQEATNGARRCILPGND